MKPTTHGPPIWPPVLILGLGVIAIGLAEVLRRAGV